MNRSLLLVGGGVMQLPVIEFAHRLGARVLCLDGNPNAPARGLADWFAVCDIKDRELCLAEARRHQAAHGLHGVVTVGTDFSTTVAWIAGALGLPGTPYEAALAAKDKGLMRRRFQEAGVASPRFEVVEGASFGKHRIGLPLPVVVKPTDNMGARGVRLVRTEAELEPTLREALGYSSVSKAIVEEYIEGPEFSLDAIVRDGLVIRCGIADRTIVFPPSFVEIGHTFPSAAASEIQEAVWTEFEKGVRALGLTWGAAKGDVKYSPEKGPVIGEIASRLSGGYMSGWTYPLTSGRSAVLWAVETALGLPLSPQPEPSARPVAERAWIGIPGRLREIRGASEARGLPGVEELFLLAQPGRETVFPRNNVEKLGNVIVTGGSAEEAEERARQARNAVAFCYEVPHAGTESFLTGNGPDPWWFSQAREFPDGDAQVWLDRAAAGKWKDFYGSTLEELSGILEREGLEPLRRSPRFWRALLVGGLSGARYAAEAW